MKKRYTMASLVILLLAGCHDKQPINERFPTAWAAPVGEEKALIAEAIADTEIKDCSEHYIRKNPTKEDEFLLACTKDGVAWRYYYMDLKYSNSTEEAEEDDYAVLIKPNRDSLNQANAPKQ